MLRKFLQKLFWIRSGELTYCSICGLRAVVRIKYDSGLSKL